MNTFEITLSVLGSIGAVWLVVHTLPWKLMTRRIPELAAGAPVTLSPDDVDRLVVWRAAFIRYANWHGYVCQPDGIAQRGFRLYRPNS